MPIPHCSNSSSFCGVAIPAMIEPKQERLIRLGVLMIVKWAGTVRLVSISEFAGRLRLK